MNSTKIGYAIVLSLRIKTLHLSFFFKSNLRSLSQRFLEAFKFYHMLVSFDSGTIFKNQLPNNDIYLMSILRRYAEKKILINFHVISTYIFDLISMDEKSTSFWHIFFDVISMREKWTSFRRTFFNPISMAKKSMLFRWGFLVQFSCKTRMM